MQLDLPPLWWTLPPGNSRQPLVVRENISELAITPAFYEFERPDFGNFCNSKVDPLQLIIADLDRRPSLDELHCYQKLLLSAALHYGPLQAQ